MAGQNIFNSIQVKAPKKNVFDLTHDVKMTGQMGNLIPCLALECVPGDKFTIGAEALIRFAPLVSPVMHRMDVSIHYFFVPNRLSWKNWEKFITDPNTPHAHPWITVSDFDLDEQQKKFIGYFGIPELRYQGPGTGYYALNAFPFAAYNRIYNEYYRDQNLIEKVTEDLIDGQNDTASTPQSHWFTMRKRAWEHDYFTSCLPWAQKGQAVSIPLGDVILKDELTAQDRQIMRWTDQSKAVGPLFGNDGGSAEAGDLVTNADSNPFPTFLDPNGTLSVDATTVSDLRRAFKLQEWLEKAARSGSRYVEHLKAFFNVNSSDKRLQRPEYITGIKSPVVISEVLNTTGEADGLPQGNMAGHGVAVTTGKAGGFYCEEHGWIIGILSIMPKTAYQQGIHRSFEKKDPLDYYFPEFAHIGEQQVRNRELYISGDPDVDEATFGYIPRYAEYKYMPNRVAGDFRGNLSFWHLGRVFENQPQLNQDFIECNPSDRIFAVTDPTVDKLYMHVLHKIKAVRPMPKFGNPSM